jgi:hypothetical protein
VKSMQPLPPAPMVLGVWMKIISPEILIRWADRMILTYPDPELWVLDLAIMKPDAIDVVEHLQRHGASMTMEDGVFLALLAYGFHQGLLPIEGVRAALWNRYCEVSWTEMTPMRQQAYLLDEEVNTDLAAADRRCMALLEPYRELGERLCRELLNTI